MAEQRPKGISRRDLLRTASVAGAAAAVGQTGSAAQEPGTASARAATYEHLTAEEAELLEAIADHLIPADDNGPGALDAGAVHYIDRSLGGAQSGSRDDYHSGLAAFDRYCRVTRNARFVDLEHTDQISALLDMQTGGASGARVGFLGSSAALFSMLRAHVLHGTFGDPYYGGNRDFIGWKLLGYPGPRVSVTTVDQRRLEAGELEAEYQSAYDWDSFVRSEDAEDA
ncbi:MAG: gluconate 2-dehydrogenase subunit 3 family protein [Acidobacteriota bacterium]|nr:gluconate 2-dehydrogenase subunit 3 family protein [Acidobacteriota bacterium]